MNVQNLKDSHHAYRKDYSKLEGMFDAAVEKMNQKRIIYYASNRIISDDSRKQMLLESYKTFAWASPVSLDDIHTEITKLAQKNKLLPISDTILNDESSLVSFFEIAGELNEKDTESLIKNTFTQESLKPAQETEISNEILQESTELPTLNLKDHQKKMEETGENRTEQFLNQYYLLKKAALNKLETEAQESPNEEKEQNDLLINNELFKDEIIFDKKLTESSPEIEKEDSFEVQQIPDRTSDEDDLYSQLLNLTSQNNKDNLFTLVESIQEDEDFYNKEESENESINLSSEDDLKPDNSFLPKEEIKQNKEDSDLLINLDLDSYNDQIEESEIEVITPELKEELVVKDLNVSDSLFESENIPSETKELVINTKENSLLEKINKRRVSLSDDQTSRSFFEEESEKEADLYTVNLLVKGAEKDYLTSKILFIISLVLTGAYVFLMFRSFYSYDYIALILLAIGVFLAWDLNAKNLTYTTIGIMIVIAACLIYNSYQLGGFSDYTHLVWFLLIPLTVSSSYQFIENRKLLSGLLKKQKRLERADQKNLSRSFSNSSENHSVFISTDD